MDDDAPWYDIPGQAMESMTDSVVEWFSQAMATVFEWLGAWWIHVDSFELAGPVQEAQPIVTWLAALVVLVGLSRAAVGMALQQRADPMGHALGGLMLFAVVAAASLPIASTLLQLSDELAVWILDVMVDDVGDRLVDVAAAAGSMAPGLVIVVGIIVILGGLVMAAGMIIREAGLIFLVALLPLAAAGYVMRGSSRWFPTLAGWVAALMLWKPVAALAYGLSTALLRGGDDDWRMLMSGVAMMFLSIAALPMLAKLLAGWAGQTAGSGGPLSPRAAAGRMGAVGAGAIAGTAIAGAGGAMAASRISASIARSGGGGASAAGGGASATGSAMALPAGTTGAGSLPAGQPAAALPAGKPAGGSPGSEWRMPDGDSPGAAGSGAGAAVRGPGQAVTAPPESMTPPAQGSELSAGHGRISRVAGDTARRAAGSRDRGEDEQ